MSSAITNRSARHKSGRKLNRPVLLGLCLLALIPLLFYGAVALFFYKH
jgi:hypothetical protein